MIFYSDAYRSKQAGCSVILQQLRRSDGIPILFACLLEEQDRIPDEERAAGRKRTTPEQTRMADQIADWFYETVPILCAKGNEEHCTDKVLKAFQKMQETERMQVFSLAIFLAVGRECFYGWQGRSQLYLFQILFDKVKARCLTGYVGECGRMQYERAAWREQTGILLCGRGMQEGMEEYGEKLAECFRTPDLGTEEQLRKHLQEFCRALETQGIRDAAAIFCLQA